MLRLQAADVLAYFRISLISCFVLVLITFMVSFKFVFKKLLINFQSQLRFLDYLKY